MEDIYYYKYIKYKKKYMALSQLHKGGMNIVVMTAAKSAIKTGLSTMKSPICNAIAAQLHNQMNKVGAQIDQKSICKIVGDTIKSKIPRYIPDEISSSAIEHFTTVCTNAVKTVHVPKTLNKEGINTYCSQALDIIISKL